MELSLIITALFTGLLGSFHCIGMCGPIALALPLDDRSLTAKIKGGILYNFGRAITYAFIGLIFGLFGQGLNLAGLQQWASIVIGIIMILSVVLPFSLKNKSFELRFIDRLFGRLKTAIGKRFRIRSNSSLFTIGLLNGFLPCGLVYVALAGAVASGHYASGSLFMFLFGLGTIPALLLVSLSGDLLSNRFKKIFTKVIPYFIVLIGILFILRGANLGIHLLSPKINTTNGTTEMKCCPSDSTEVHP